jgi:uracil-DNA glycosylase
MTKDIINILHWYAVSGCDEIIDSNQRDFQSKESAQPITMQNNTSNEKPLTLSYKELLEQARRLADNSNNLEDLKSALLNFEGLSIKKTATSTVFADGNINAKIMAIGEAPGANEDAQGIPFCGISGKLLDLMFKSIGLSRLENLYITNSVFWRPPGNRRPTPEEANICLPFVEKHIALINPALLILVGSTSATALLDTNESITQLRSKTHYYHNKYLSDKIPVRAIFHPSYLLRQPSQKKLAWFDLLKIKKEFL